MIGSKPRSHRRRAFRRSERREIGGNSDAWIRIAGSICRAPKHLALADRLRALFARTRRPEATMRPRWPPLRASQSSLIEDLPSESAAAAAKRAALATRQWIADNLRYSTPLISGGHLHQYDLFRGFCFNPLQLPFVVCGYTSTVFSETLLVIKHSGYLAR
jgi:hypothetical protein